MQKSKLTITDRTTSELKSEFSFLLVFISIIREGELFEAQIKIFISATSRQSECIQRKKNTLQIENKLH